MTKKQARSVDVLVVGAGPVGLFGALCAARSGLRVELVDETWQGFGRGYATVLHPGSLRLLGQLGLSDKLFELGRRLDQVTVYVGHASVATLDLGSPALAIPQSALQDVLLKALRAEGVQPGAPQQATTITQTEDGVEIRVMRRELVTLGSPAHYSEWEPVESSLVHASFVIGADGYDSKVRSSLGIELASLGSTESFAMFEYPAAVDPNDVKLCFDDGLGSVMVPLASGRVRWGFQIETELDATPDVGRLRALLSERAPWYRDGTDRVDWGTVTHFERRLARRFGKGRVWLAGDAAHVTSPFGGQSMNLGLSEAHDLAQRMGDCIVQKKHFETLEHYERAHQREWHKLLGYNVRFDLLPHAPPWLAGVARRIVPALPASGYDLEGPLKQLGLVID